MPFTSFAPLCTIDRTTLAKGQAAERSKHKRMELSDSKALSSKSPELIVGTVSGVSEGHSARGSVRFGFLR